MIAKYTAPILTKGLLARVLAADADETAVERPQLASGRPVNRQIGGDDATYLTELETMFEGLRKAGVPKH
jgi:hypothetical protein